MDLKNWKSWLIIVGVLVAAVAIYAIAFSSPAPEPAPATATAAKSQPRKSVRPRTGTERTARVSGIEEVRTDLLELCRNVDQGSKTQI